MSVTVPTANKDSPPREWNRTEAQHSAASFLFISIQLSVEQALAGSTRRTHDPQCPCSAGTGPRIGVSLVLSSSSSSSSSPSFFSSSSESSSMSMSMASSPSLFSFFFELALDLPLPSKPIAFFSSSPKSLASLSTTARTIFLEVSVILADNKHI